MAASSKSDALRAVIDEVQRLSGRFSAATNRLAEGTGLSASQLMVLTAVVRADRPPTVPQIGRSLGHTRQSVQRLADALVERDMLSWSENPDHARAKLLIATDSGRDAYTRADRNVDPWAARVTRDLDKAHLDQLVANLHELRQSVERAERDQRTTR